MLFRHPCLLLFAFLLITSLHGLAQTADFYTDKVADYPDIWQEDPQGDFPGGGDELCCPTSVSSSLMYFAKHGYPNLVPQPGSSDFETQAALIRLLASKAYLNTNLSSGTPPSRMISGAQRYITECGYEIKRLEYEGWRPIGKDQADMVVAPLPDLEWIKKGIADPDGTVWLNVGWYKKGTEAGTWIRTGGHWVTLVGFGPGPNDLLIHNSLIHRTAPVTDLADYQVTLSPLPSDGSFTVVKENGEHDTDGMYQVEGPGLPTRNSEAFLDAAIVVVIGK